MSRAVGKPVRVQWSRADEHGWSPKGPAHWVTARAGVDAQGKLIAWDYMDRSQPWSTSGTPLLASQQVGLKPTGQGNPDGATGGGELYDIPESESGSGLDSLDSRRPIAAANQQPARSRRSGAHVCQRIVRRRDCLSVECRSG